MKYLNFFKSRNTERKIEIQLALEFLGHVNHEPILEVGNVLVNYAPWISKMVVDKYERHPKVLNIDVMEINASLRFRKIISISTLEHVGVDAPDSFEPHKGIEALTFLKSLLLPGGCLLATVPLGYNPILDNWLMEQPDTNYMRRINKRNDWVNCSIKESARCHYGAPFKCANGLAIYRFAKPLNADIRNGEPKM